MKLFVKIFAFFFLSKKEKSEQGSFEELFYTQILPCFIVWGLKMEKNIRVSYFHFIMFSFFYYFFFALLRS